MRELPYCCFINVGPNFFLLESWLIPLLDTLTTNYERIYLLSNGKPSPRGRPWPGNSGDPGENTQVEDDEGADRQQDGAHQRVHHLA